MLPAFEKKSNGFGKRENQNWWESNALKSVPNTSEVETPAVVDRDRAKNSKSRLHPRPVVLRQESLQSLPTIKEPPEPTRTAPGNLAMNGDESSHSFGSRNENLRLCIKRWKKISLSKANASSVHFEVSILFKNLGSQIRGRYRVLFRNWPVFFYGSLRVKLALWEPRSDRVYLYTEIDWRSLKKQLFI